MAGNLMKGPSKGPSKSGIGGGSKSSFKSTPKPSVSRSKPVSHSSIGSSSKSPLRSTSSSSRPSGGLLSGGAKKPVSSSSKPSGSMFGTKAPASRPVTKSPAPSTKPTGSLFGNKTPAHSKPAPAVKSPTPMASKTPINSSKPAKTPFGVKEPVSGVKNLGNTKPLGTSKPVSSGSTSVMRSSSQSPNLVKPQSMPSTKIQGAPISKSSDAPRYNATPLRARSVTSGLPLLSNGYSSSYANDYAYYGSPYGNSYAYGSSLGVELINHVSSMMQSKAYQEKVLLARVVCCFYVAYADGMIAAQEKEILDFMVGEVLNNGKVSLSIKNELKSLINAQGTSFVQAEKYFRDLENEELIPLISLAEDVASCDSSVHGNESEAVTKLRSYISDRTGYDFSDTAMSDAKYQDDLLLAKLAVCCFISKADKTLTDDEREELGIIINQLLKNGTVSGALKETANAIVNNEDYNFIFVEQFLKEIRDEDLPPLISVADAISDKGSGVTIDENNAIAQLRLYVTTRTGEDYSSVNIDDGDLMCPGCAAQMMIVAGTFLECPFCGTRKTIKPKDQTERDDVISEE